MRNKIIEMIGECHDLALVALKNRVDGGKGEFLQHFVRADGNHSNILLVEGASADFLDAVGELMNEDILELVPMSPMLAAHDAGEFYDLPIAKDTKRIYKKTRWLPVLVRKGKKFPM